MSKPKMGKTEYWALVKKIRKDQGVSVIEARRIIKQGLIDSASVNGKAEAPQRAKATQAVDESYIKSSLQDRIERLREMLQACDVTIKGAETDKAHYQGELDRLDAAYNVLTPQKVDQAAYPEEDFSVRSHSG